MRIAWFRHADTDCRNPLDSSAALIDELRATHDIDVIVERTAHDFVWQQMQRPWDLVVFELDNTPAHQFIWGYLPNYPGIVLLHSIEVANLRVAILASRAVVVSDSGLADRLQDRFPRASIRHAPACGGPPDHGGPSNLSQSGADLSGPRLVTFAFFDERSRGHALLHRAFERARNAGATFDVFDAGANASALRECDVAIVPSWPPFHSPPTPLLAAMGAGKAVVTTETEARAEWPAIDPQTWRPRGLAVEQTPVAVTVDPRDEEHSLMLAIRRLSADAALRDQLGRAARAWWETHATPQHAAAEWRHIFQEAATLSPPPRPDDWPRQFLADGTELARDIRREFGIAPEPRSRTPDPG